MGKIVLTKGGCWTQQDAGSGVLICGVARGFGPAFADLKGGSTFKRGHYHAGWFVDLMTV